MAYKITEECTTCGACEPECPNNAISSGPDIFEINDASCTECVGFFDTPRCAAVCPSDSCVPGSTEGEAALIDKAKKLHPGKDFSGAVPSRFKK